MGRCVGNAVSGPLAGGRGSQKKSSRDSDPFYGCKAFDKCLAMVACRLVHRLCGPRRALFPNRSWTPLHVALFPTRISYYLHHPHRHLPATALTPMRVNTRWKKHLKLGLASEHIYREIRRLYATSHWKKNIDRAGFAFGISQVQP